MAEKHCFVPADVPEKSIDAFVKHYTALTRNTGNLLLFSADQKIEHLHKDFFGADIDPADSNPNHLFSIASQADIGAMATQLGLIARYGKQYKNINYIVKLNGKTDIIPTDYSDPLSKELWNIQQVAAFKQQTNLPICGVGYTVYLGSQYEAEMLTQAAQIVYEAHQHGLVTILWMYPRGECLEGYERHGMIIAGAAGAANALGADFAKINLPEPSDEEDMSSLEWLAVAGQAAGNTKLLLSGGQTIAPKKFIKQLQEYMMIENIAGAAIGRNIHQKSLADAVAFCKELAAVVYK
ncbi:MAG: aldolase [Candidatus Babeliales bacterium]